LHYLFSHVAMHNVLVHLFVFYDAMKGHNWEISKNWNSGLFLRCCAKTKKHVGTTCFISLSPISPFSLLPNIVLKNQKIRIGDDWRVKNGWNRRELLQIHGVIRNLESAGAILNFFEEVFGEEKKKDTYFISTYALHLHVLPSSIHAKDNLLLSC